MSKNSAKRCKAKASYYQTKMELDVSADSLYWFVRCYFIVQSLLDQFGSSRLGHSCLYKYGKAHRESRRPVAVQREPLYAFLLNSFIDNITVWVT